MSEVRRPDPLRGWRIAGVVATLLIVATIPLYALREQLVPRVAMDPAEQAEANFVGREQCRDCHEEAWESWRDSDHDRAMEVADSTTVLGDFDDAEFEHFGVTTRFYQRDGEYYVYTEGPGGEMGEFQVAYTFGYDPLQQYLIPFPGGRLQVLTIAWDAERERWFALYPDEDIAPDDWLHWTRNAMTWNGMCAECHSTNLIKGYDAETQTYETSWSEIDVSCEACHGPGSRHVDWAEMPPMARPESADYELAVPTSDLTSSELVELCAPCHSRRAELGDYDHTNIEPLHSYVPTALDEGLYHADGQILDEVYVYGSFTQSKMYQNDVRCSDCHDVHSLELVREGNALCLQCHRGDTYDVHEHHFHTQTIQSEPNEGEPNEGALCVRCHMPEQPYMGVDWRADHSIRVPRPDLSVQIGTPNACTQSGCHETKSDEWAAHFFTEWYGRARRSHYGTTLAAGRQQAPGVDEALIRLARDALYPGIVRATALQLLRGYSNEAAIQTFDMALQDEDPLIRHTAVNGLTTADPERLIDLVSPLLFDPARAVRQEAGVRLAGIPDQRLEPYQREALAEALEEYRESMSHSLDFASSAYNLGNLSLTLGEQDLAERYFITAIEIDDLFYPAKSNLALMYNTQGRNQEAEQLLREILEAHPEQYEAAYSLGLLLGEMNRYDEAAVYLEHAANGLPNMPRVSYNLGVILDFIGRHDDAEAAFLHVLDVAPEDPEALFALGESCLRRGRFAEAIEYADRLTAAQPDNPIGRRMRAAAEQSMREP